MCGIVIAGNFHDFSSPALTVEALYQAQKNRGTEGFGFVAVALKKKHAKLDPLSVKRFTKEEQTIASLHKSIGHLLMFHHRFPTSTGNRVTAAHPITIKRGGSRYHFIHNGIISNDDEVLSLHLKEGRKYSTYQKEGKKYSFNDSECLAHEIVSAYRDGTQPRAEGSAAWAMLVETPDENTRLVFGRNSMNPLKLYYTGGTFLLSSEGPGELIEAHKTFSLDVVTGEISELPAILVPSGYSATPYYGSGRTASEDAMDDDLDYCEADGKADYWSNKYLEDSSNSLEAPPEATDYFISDDGQAFVAGEPVDLMDTDDLAEELMLLPPFGTANDAYDDLRFAIIAELEKRGLDVDPETGVLATVAGFVPRPTASLSGITDALMNPKQNAIA